MLVVPLASLLHGFPRKMLDLRQHWGQSGRVRGGLVGGYYLRCHPRALESGAKESSGGGSVAKFAFGSTPNNGYFAECPSIGRFS